MKTIFEKPEIQIVLVGTNDIITTSGSTDVSNNTIFGSDLWTPWLDL